MKKKKILSLLVAVVFFVTAMIPNVSFASEGATTETTQTSTETTSETTTQTTTETTASTTETTTEVTTETTTTQTTEAPVLINNALADPVGAAYNYLLKFVNSSNVRGGGNITLNVNGNLTSHKQMMVLLMDGNINAARPGFCIEKGSPASSDDELVFKDYSDSVVNLTNNRWLKFRLAYALRFGSASSDNFGSSLSNYQTMSQENYARYLATQLLVWNYIYHSNELSYSQNIPGEYSNAGISGDYVASTDAENGLNGRLVYWYNSYKDRIDNVRSMPTFLNNNWAWDYAFPQDVPTTYEMTWNAGNNRYEISFIDTNWNKATNDNAGWYTSHPFPLNNCLIDCPAGITYNIEHILDGDGYVTAERITFYSDNPLGSVANVKFTKDDFNTAGTIQDVFLLGGLSKSVQHTIIQGGSLASNASSLNLTTDSKPSASIFFLQKTDEDTGTPIFGCTFALYSDAGCTTEVYRGTTRADGQLTISDITPGTYWVRELGCPANYILDTSIHELIFIDGVTTPYNATNKRKATVVINKKDELSLAAMPGIQFGIYSDLACTTLIQTLTTDQYGQSTTLLPEGTYYIKELSTDGYHFIDDTVHTVVATNTATNYLNLTNAPRGRIEIVKTGDSVISATDKTSEYGPYTILTYGQRSVANVTFEIRDASDNLIETVTTDADGKALSDYLPVATYTIKEVNTPAGLIPAATHTVTVVDKTTITVGETGDPFINALYGAIDNVTNNHVSSTINIYKEGETRTLTNGVWVEGTTPLEGVVFGLYNTNAINNKTGQQIVAKDTCLGYALTDNEGKASFEVTLPEGDYYYKEISAPKKYEVNLEKHPFELVLGNANNTLDVNKDEPLVDDLKEGRLQVSKLGDVVSGKTTYSTTYGNYSRLTFSKGDVAGVEFTVKDETGAIVDTITTDANGEAISKMLPVGKYSVTESKTPSGLHRLDTPVSVNIVDKTTLTVPLTSALEGVDYVGAATVLNDVVSAEINVYKEGEILNIEDGTYSFGKKPLEGVVFGIYANADIKDKAGAVVVKKDECLGFIVTNEDGKASLKESLVGGSYYYKEVKALEGYVIDTEKKPFTVALGNDATTTVEVNKSNPDVNQLYKAQIQLVKVDAADHEIKLSDTTFNLYNQDNKLMGTYVTDANGLVKVDGLPYGQYYFQEQKAKDGYDIDKEHIAIVVNGTTTKVNAQFANSKTPQTPVPPTPQTGDSFNPLLLIFLTIVATTGFVVLKRNKDKENNEEEI